MNGYVQPLFHEVQSFRFVRLRILLAIPPVAMLMLVIWQVVLGHRWGKQPMSNASVIGWTIFLWLVYLRLVTVRLVTDVRAGEISVSMRDLWRARRVPVSDITSAKLVTYAAERDYGSYGVLTTQCGKAYLAGGGQGPVWNLSKVVRFLSAPCAPKT
jgi:hypothetical protein